MEKEQLMQLTYDRESDVLYLSIGDPRPAISREIGDDVLLRIDAQTGEVVGMTVLNLSMRDSLEKLPIAINLRALGV
jgi:uncharacterized protein YuzE